MKNVFSLFLLITGLHLSFSLQAQPLEQQTFKENIKTLQVYKLGDVLSEPIIKLNSGETITVSFDDLDAYQKNYSYTLIHCSADWQKSDLYDYEYLQNYTYEDINEYAASFNTTTDFYHYTITIPNQNMTPTLSGNYILRVYEDNDPKNVVLQARFMILEPKLITSVTLPPLSAYSNLSGVQEFEFSVENNGYYIRDMQEDLQIRILKNMDWNTVLKNPVPDYIGSNKLKFNNYAELKFKGGNEYRFFNTNSIRFNAENIKKIDFFLNKYHFRLVNDQDRSFEEYKSYQDINGKFKIDRERSTDPELESDYVYVYFSLDMDAPLNDGDIYIYGDCTQRKFDERYLMKYNLETRAYEKRLLLKQGYYNYKYVLKNRNKTYDLYFTSGNHAVTENDFIILLYHRDMQSGYDRLVGVKKFKSNIHSNQ